MKTRNQGGFTIIEIIIAIVVLTVGVLALVSTAALVTRMIARGQRSADATAFAARRIERIRAFSSGLVGGAICVVPNPGSDTLYRGTNWVAINTWTATDLGNQNYRIKLVTNYKTTKNKTRRDSTETTISCNQQL